MMRRLKRLLRGRSDGAVDTETTGDSRVPPVRVLMVCMGNICRSPTAEGVLRAKLQRAGLQSRVVVDSAGTHGYHAGEPPDPRAIRHAAQRGYDIAGQRARAVTNDDFARFHWILAMDQANLDSLHKRAPAGSMARVELVLQQGVGAATHEVPDPYYGSAAGFDQVLDLLETACDGFVARLMTDAPARSPWDGSAPAQS